MTKAAGLGGFSYYSLSFICLFRFEKLFSLLHGNGNSCNRVRDRFELSQMTICRRVNVANAIYHDYLVLAIIDY